MADLLRFVRDISPIDGITTIEIVERDVVQESGPMLMRKSAPYQLRMLAQQTQISDISEAGSVRSDA